LTTDLVTPEEASKLLEVPVEQVNVMVEEGMLTPAPSSDGLFRFDKAEVLALRNTGG